MCEGLSYLEWKVVFVNYLGDTSWFEFVRARVGKCLMISFLGGKCLDLDGVFVNFCGVKCLLWLVLGY